MQNYYWVIGVCVSVFLFGLSYRKIFGAKKERIRAANSELEKVLVRRIVLENHSSSFEEIDRLLEGKARDYQVKPSELLSEAQLANTIYTRVVENDFILADRRQELIERLDKLIASIEKGESTEEDSKPPEVRSGRLLSQASTLGIMGVAVTLFGTFLSMLPQLSPDTIITKAKAYSSITSALITFMASALAVLITYIYYRQRDPQPEPSKGDASLQYGLFEREVAKLFKRHELRSIAPQHSDASYDWKITTKGGHTMLIEAKLWPPKVPAFMSLPLVHRLTEALKREDASEAIIITKGQVSVPARVLESKEIRIMSIEEFKDYLKRIS
jgi:hypothetical protein